MGGNSNAKERGAIYRMSRATDGYEVEDRVASHFIEVFGDLVEQTRTGNYDIEILHTKVEVKSASYKVGKKNRRKGKFYFIPKNLGVPDYYAFVIRNFQGSKYSETFFVEGKEICKYFKDHKRPSKRFSLSIPALMKHIKRLDFSEVLDNV